jgi:starch synthase
VATRVEGTSELVIETRTGLLVPAQAPQDLATAIENMLTDPAQAKTMGEAGRERATSEFSWEKMVDRYCELYSTLLMNPR